MTDEKHQKRFFDRLRRMRILFIRMNFSYDGKAKEICHITKKIFHKEKYCDFYSILQIPIQLVF